ncbi:MAG: hypothetical protein R6X33_09020 [Candidatus Brocadiia bacterium]
MRLFDNIQRCHHGTRNYLEDGFSFVNRSARPAARRVRGVLEAWFDKYPDGEKPPLRSLFRSDFDAAFWQLLLYALFRQLGASLTPHPVLPTESNRSPDYLVQWPGGAGCFIEATVARDQSDDEIGKERRMAILYDEIERMDMSEFSIKFSDVQDTGGLQPSPKKLRQFIENKIADLDPDELTSLIKERGLGALPSWRYCDGEYGVTIVVYPRTDLARKNTENHSIRALPTKARAGSPAPALYRSMSKKATYYGQLRQPFLVAINSMSPWITTDIDMVEALFGRAKAPLVDGQCPHGADGLWCGPRGPRNRRVSGVIGGTGVVPWSIGRARLCLYYNPFAERPCADIPWCLDTCSVCNDALHWEEGATVGELLGLPSDWPGQLFPN